MRWWRVLPGRCWGRLQGDHARQQTDQEVGERAVDSDVADPSKRTENVTVELEFVSRETYLGQVVSSRLWSDLYRWSGDSDLYNLDRTYGGMVMVNPMLSFF